MPSLTSGEGIFAWSSDKWNCRCRPMQFCSLSRSVQKTERSLPRWEWTYLALVSPSWMRPETVWRKSRFWGVSRNRLQSFRNPCYAFNGLVLCSHLERNLNNRESDSSLCSEWRFAEYAPWTRPALVEWAIVPPCHCGTRLICDFHQRHELPVLHDLTSGRRIVAEVLGYDLSESPARGFQLIS